MKAFPECSIREIWNSWWRSKYQEALITSIAWLNSSNPPWITSSKPSQPILLHEARQWRTCRSKNQQLIRTPLVPFPWLFVCLFGFRSRFHIQDQWRPYQWFLPSPRPTVAVAAAASGRHRTAPTLPHGPHSDSTVAHLSQVGGFFSCSRLDWVLLVSNNGVPKRVSFFCEVYLVDSLFIRLMYTLGTLRQPRTFSIMSLEPDDPFFWWISSAVH